MDKALVVHHIRKTLQEKQASFDEMLTELNQAIADDTKSSAGDKFETARAMAQQEIDKVHQQLSEVKRQLALLSSFTSSNTATANAGNVVETDNGHYFIGVPAGQIMVGGTTIYCISSASPLAQQLIGKKPDETVQAGNVKHTIIAVS